MRARYLLLGLILGLFLISSASAVCTITLDKEIYAPTETVTAEITCDSSLEKNKAYSLNWSFNGVDNYEWDTGTTPATTGETFYETFLLNSTYAGTINVSMNGTQLEGVDGANVTAASGNSLLISNITVGGKWLGLITSVKGTVKDENGKKISGGTCRFSSWSNDETTMLASGIAPMFDGQLKFDWILDYSGFAEATDYRILLSCYCGNNNSLGCINEDGTAIEYHLGSSSAVFTTNNWATLNEDPLPITYVNGTNYGNPAIYAGFGEEVYYRINASNNFPSGQLRVENQAHLVDNTTGGTYEESFVQGNSVDTETKTFSFATGNSSVIADFEISRHAPTGVYFIRNFYKVYHDNVEVSQGIVDTETFNVTGTESSFILENVVTDKSNYYTGEHVHVCVNLTNNFDKRIEFKVLYNFRCGSNNLDSDTDRTLVDEHIEYRALSSNTTQNQCVNLNANFHDHLRYKTTQCYASVTVESIYIDTFDSKKSITSPNFNLTDFGMYPEYELNPDYPLIRLFPDWRRFDDIIDDVARSYNRAKINLTKLNETWLDPDGEITDNAWDVYVTFTEKMPRSPEIYNYTVEYANGTQIDNPIENKCLQWKNGIRSSACSIGIENVNFSDINDDYFIVKVWFEDFSERQTEALEGINSKTGTFHMDINCPSEGEIGSDIDCIITAQIEESQTVEKEVDFTCYIIDNGDIYSSINFNQMVTRSPVSIIQSFPIPHSFKDDSQYIVQCYGDYYNLGKRRDSFYDTFATRGWVSGSGGGSQRGLPSITGGVVDEDGGGIGEISETIKKNYLYFVIFIILIFIVILFVRKKKECPEKNFNQEGNKINWGEIVIYIFILLILIGVLFGLFYGFKAIANSFDNDSQTQEIVSVEQIETPLPQSYSMIKDKLFRGIILTAFIVLMIIILFKALNLRGEVRFGHDGNSYEDKKHTKMQNKLNRMLVHDEIKRQKNKKGYNVRKMSAEDFSKRLYKSERNKNNI